MPLLVVLCVAQLMVVLDATIVNVALPEMQTALGFSTADLQWVVSAYALTFGGFLMLGGRAADLFGRRRMFLAGLVVFSVASLVGGLAGSPGILVAARAVQGLGAALLSPAALSIITTAFADAAQRNRALGVWGAVGASGVALGNILGGVLVAGLSWRWVMFVNVPIGVAALLAAPRLVPESRDTAARRLDIPGAVLVTGGLAVLIYALVEAEGAGFGSAQTLALALAAALLLASFIAFERRAASPLVPLGIFARRALTGGNVVALLASAAFPSMFFLMSVFMQRSLGYDALQTGLAFLPMAAVLVVGSGILGPRLVPRVGARTQAVASMLVMAGGFIVTALTLRADGGFVETVLPGTVLIGLGMAFVFPAFMVAAVDGVPDADQGVASGLINTSQQTGAALGLAILVVVAATRSDAVGGGEDATALVEGYQAAFLAGTVLPLLAAGAAALLLRPAAKPTTAAAQTSRRSLAAPQVAAATLCVSPTWVRSTDDATFESSGSACDTARNALPS